MDNENQDIQSTPSKISQTNQESTPPVVKEPQQNFPKKNKRWLLISLVILILGATGVFAFKYYKEKQQLDNQKSNSLPSPLIVDNNPTPSELYPFSYNFCGDMNYCSMNEICSNIPISHGVCVSEEDCTNQYLCGRKETLMSSGMEIMFLEREEMFVEDITSKDGIRITRIGYILIRNIENAKQQVDVASFECLNYEGLCEDFNVIYPPSFQIKERDVVIFPVYIENYKNLKGLASLELSYHIGEKLSMINVDLIFNGDKTCIYQWGNLEKSSRVYFKEPSKIDWTQHCQ